MHEQRDAPPREDNESPWRDLKFAPLLLLPLVCCGLPLAIAAVAAAGAGLVGGLTAAVVVFAVGIGIVVVRRQRRCASDACTPSELRAGRRNHFDE